MGGGSKSDMVSSGAAIRTVSGRLIPKRGQVKVAIVLGLAHSLASIFSHHRAQAGEAAAVQFSHLQRSS